MFINQENHLYLIFITEFNIVKKSTPSRIIYLTIQSQSNPTIYACVYRSAKLTLKFIWKCKYKEYSRQSWRRTKLDIFL